MNREVWKFKVQMGEVHGHDSTVAVPAGAEVMSVSHRWDEVFVWLLVDPMAPPVPRRFGYFATGVPVPDGWKHVGTVHVLGEQWLSGSRYVWHVFEEPSDG